MKNINKLFLSFGTVAISTLPVIAVVSCGNEGDTSTDTPIVKDGITITHKGNQILSITVDGSQYTSADDIIAKLGEITTENGLTRVTNPADLIIVTGNDQLKTEVESHRTPTTPNGQTGAPAGNTPTGTQNVVANTNTIDITNLSVEDTIDALVKMLHVNMDAIGANEDAWTISDDMNKVLAYMDQVNVNKVVTLRNGTETYQMDFRPVQQWVDKVAEAASQEHNPNAARGKSLAIGAALGNYGMPEIAFYSGYCMGVATATAMSEFMTLSTVPFGSVSNDEFFDQHGYIQMLNEYHRIIWQFVQSDFYESWIVGKQFKLIHTGTHVVEIVNPGERFDDLTEDHPGPGGETTHGDDDHKESSNFEVQFGLRLLNAFGYLERTSITP